MTQAQYRVLVVEDEPGIRGILRTLLQTAHYRVIEAETVARAEIEARSHQPDLLIVDLGLPDADGGRLMREVWGPSRDADTRSLRVFIKNIRQQIEPDPTRPQYLVIEAGIGYRLVVPQS